MITSVSSEAIKCAKCERNINSTARKNICCACNQVFHTLCIPLVTKFDDFYDDANEDWICFNCIKNSLPFTHFESDREFVDAISELNMNGQLAYAHNLDDKIFNPFEINTDYTSNPFADIDPDVNFFNHFGACHINSNYYFEDTFNDKCLSMSISSTNFSMIHLNIRSAVHNLSKFDLYMKSLITKFSIIALTETWFTESNHNLYGIDGYDMVDEHRKSKKGGGVALYIHSSILYKVRDDLKVFDDNIESKFIEIDKCNFGVSKHIIAGVVYRPPNTDLCIFNGIIEDMVRTISNENKDCYLIGDWNINLLNSNDHNPTSDFLECMFSELFVPTINKPTRVSENSATLIDNIFTNCYNFNECLAGIMYSDISDHFPIFLIDCRKTYSTKEEYVTKRIYSERNIIKFNDVLSGCDWRNVLCSSDPEQAYSLFYRQIMTHYDNCFPLKTFRSSYINRKPWITDELREMIKRKNKLMAKTKKHPYSLKIKCEYQYYQKIVQKFMRNAEREYYHNLFEQYKCDLVKSWKVIKQLINRKRINKIPRYFIINDKQIDDKLEIANSFNKFYTNLGPSLASKIPDKGVDPSSFLTNHISNSIFLSPVTEDEIAKILNALKKSSPGWDGLSAHIIIKCYTSFLNPLTHICNLSIQKGVFPSELKIAKVIPLYKGGDDAYLVNYRPVSVLPVFSKLYEKLMYERLVTFFDEMKILYSYQFGFRKHHSTGMALMILVDRISKALQEGEYVLGVFIDFSKAFDTVNHKILLNKLWHYGIRGVAHKWMTSYLYNRKQFVCYDGVNSPYDNITCGVPQGSILGPLLFLIYVNDMASVSDKLFTLLFADDTNTFLSGKDINALIRTMNEELSKLVGWMYANKLSLNIAKTHFLIFNSKGKQKPLFNERLVINETELMQDNKTKFLGVIIDDKLSWGAHIQYIKSKISKGVGIICKVKNVLNVGTLINLYNCFVYPYINYAVEIWGDTYDCYINTILKLQKKSLRIISRSASREHTSPLFSKFRILNVRKVHIYKVGMTMFKVHQNLVPFIFSQLFTYNSTIHSHYTRQSDQLHVPIAKTNYMMRSISIKGVRIWNKLNSKINYNCSFLCYKSRLKQYLMECEDNLLF